MATRPYPVLVWRDAAGAFSAALVGDFEPAAASAPGKEDALRQLKELLEWRAEHEPWNVDPDLADAAFTEVKVEVRPQYHVGQRRIPCPETIWLRVPCVTGKQESGLRLCVVPHLQVQFNFQDTADLQGLVAHYVKDALQGFTPEQLAACLPPRGAQLETVSVRITSERVPRLPPADQPAMKILFAVADPLLHDAGRKRPAAAACGREDLAETLARKLGNEKANVLLVGAAGVGKSTLLLDAARRVARAASPSQTGAEDQDEEMSAKELRTYRFWRGSAGRVIAGMRYLGEWEERCEEFIAQLNAMEGVFCAENLLELVQVGGEGPGDSVAAFLLPHLQRGELRMAAEATSEEIEACRRLLPGLLDVFQVMTVPAFDEAASEHVLRRIAAAHAASSRLEVQAAVPAAVRQLFRRFQPYTAFPGPAATFVRQLCDRRAKAGQADRPVVSVEDVISQFIQQTGLPEILLRDELLLPAGEVRERLARQIIGQPEAIVAASRLIAAMKAGLTDPARPLGVFLFCGPTGVGKTALARVLVEFCFGASGAKDRLVRLDMSEYAGWGAGQRLLRGPDGQPAQWIARVRRQPFCVVLFDEIEKAAPEVFDVLLSLLDEGRLTDGFGRVTWFRSAIVIMTSNLGANAPDSAGFGSRCEPAYESEARKFFRPEFFNRLDGVVTFKPLGLADVELITRKELAELAAREGLATANLQLAWTDRLVSFIAREGYDHRFGARPLQRVIENRIAVPLARWRVANAKAKAMILHIDLDEHSAVTIRESGSQ